MRSKEAVVDYIPGDEGRGRVCMECGSAGLPTDDVQVDHDRGVTRADRIQVFVRLHHAGWYAGQLLDVWRAAEQLGFDGVSVYDVPSRPALECWSALAYCLGATSRVSGVPLVLSNPHRHPALVAKMAWDLNALSGGRVVLGLGAGGAEEDLSAYGLGGVSMGTRLDWLEEALVVIRRLLSGDRVTSPGRQARIDGLRLAGSGPPPPVLVGGHGSRLVGIAARHADAVNVGYELSDGEWGALARDLARLREQASPRAKPLILSHNADAESLTEERLAALAALGVRWFFVVFRDAPGTRLMERFAEELLPSVRGSWPDYGGRLPAHRTPAAGEIVESGDRARRCPPEVRGSDQ
jgi:alkanesulfonate monooxygenase SsuD/methylene tetrahydromethanopterin reductase-like flavin-dependent oxidoreductase (luciferase family)